MIDKEITNTYTDRYIRKFYCNSSRKLIIYGLILLISIAGGFTIFIYISYFSSYSYCNQCEVNDYTKYVVSESFNYCNNANHTKRHHRLSMDDSYLSLKVHEIVLFGDSLISVPDLHYGLGNNIRRKIRLKHPDLNFKVAVQGKKALHINDLRIRMCEDIIGTQVEAVIVLWDSDITTRQDHQSKDAIEWYIQNLLEIMATLKSQVKYFAIAGPGLKGELPDGRNSIDQCLDFYQELNRNISNIYNITYIDVRKVFLQYDKEKGWDRNQGYVTEDSQHASRLGTKILEELFYNQLELWYNLLY